MESIIKLQRNPESICKEAARLLVKIADNILADPSNGKLRTLQKTNHTISKKILNVFGGVECLVLMGFEDRNSFLMLPMEASLDKLKVVKDDIIKHYLQPRNENGTTQKIIVEELVTNEPSEELIVKVVLPPYHKKYANDFLNNIAYRFHLAQFHDSKELQDRAYKLIPIHLLELNAQENFRELQRKIKKGELSDSDMTLQDMIILELLDWFKNDFFHWVDSPICENCKSQTKFSHMATDPNMLKYTDRVEMHICQTCNAATPFARYNDLNILMATRKGRCGEWSNCFTLFCRAMGWDSRQVYDETDHVWTEVYSIGKKRWVHCDPCENICDRPLMYEAGWNKTVSYVIAYSGEEVQDVTWRYTSKHKEVLTRRTKCSEAELVQTLVDLRTERQRNLTEARKKYLAKRLLAELCELMVEKQPNDEEKKGRTSGSLSWRLARGEQEITTNFIPYIWKFNSEHIQNPVTIRYSTALDVYELSSENKNCARLNGWHKGVSEVTGIFRKEERDWKMVYLSRSENAPVGIIKWVFEINDPYKLFHLVDVHADYTLYENGLVEISVAGDSHRVIFPRGSKQMRIQQLSGSRKIEITARLSGGQGNVAWQHAQLFRQSMDSTECSFNVTFTFKDV